MDVQWKFYTDDGCCRFSSCKTVQCQLCNRMRKTFYCKSCVRNGDFMHSTSRLAERFAEKRLLVSRMQQMKNELVVESEKHIDNLRLYENKVEDIRTRKERISMLKAQVAETRKKLEQKEIFLQELKDYNRSAKESLSRNDECKKEIVDNINKIVQKRPALDEELNSIKPKLKDLIRCRIEETVAFIFPIAEIQSAKHSSLTSDSQEDIKNELAEASRLVFVRGRWVQTDNWGETQHSIAGPSLPDSGDYSPYIHWISANKDNAFTMTNSSIIEHKSAYNYTAALTYTTQLVNVMAYHVDLRLPNRLYFSEFCTKNLNERKFMKCVTQLNANILMLCLSQSVDPHLLQPSQTLRNILILLDRNHSDLGRLEIADIANSSVSFFEDQLAQYLKAATARLSISDVEDEERDPPWTEAANNENNDDEYDSDHISTDWEAVPLVACPEAMPGSYNSRKQISTQSSITGGLMSTASSLVSIWRGWSNNK